jgi:hypothetical protein
VGEGSGSCVLTDVGVQVPPSAPTGGEASASPLFFDFGKRAANLPRCEARANLSAPVYNFGSMNPITSRLPPDRRDAWALGALAVLTLGFFWPMLRDPLHSFVGVFGGKGDVEGTFWWMWWAGRAIADPELSLWRTPTLFFPFGTAVAPLYGSVLNVFFYLPFLYGLPQPLANNLWCLVIALADAAVAYAAFRAIARDRLAGFVAAVVWSLAAYKFLEFRDGHLPQILLTFIPAAAWALWRLREEPSWRAAILAGLFLMLDGCGYYQHLYGAFFLAVAFLLSGLCRYRGDRAVLWRYVQFNLLAAAIVAVGVAVFYGPLIGSVSVGQDAPWIWPDSFPAFVALEQSASHLLILKWGSLAAHWDEGGPAMKVEQVFLLVFSFAALIVGVRRWKKARFWLLLSAFFVAIVAGPVPHLRVFSASGGFDFFVLRNPVYLALFSYFPSFNRLYWPDTFWPYAVLGIALTLAVGLARPAEEKTGEKCKKTAVFPLFIAGVSLCFALWFTSNNPFIGGYFDQAAPQVLAEAEGEAFFPLPTPAGDDYCLPLIVMTGKAMVGGRGRDLGYLEPEAFTEMVDGSAWPSALHSWSRMDEAAAPTKEDLAAWKTLGARHVVIHRPRCAAWDERFRWTRENVGLENYLRERLEPLLGAPIAEDATWLIYELP